MRKLTMFFLGLLLFVPLSALAVEKGADNAPPIEQTLVREGDFALKLADNLGLVKTDNEADAERVLANAGIAPDNGWISDFPVTPDVLAEIKASVGDAAEGGRIKMDKKTAEDRFYALSKELGLPVVADTGTATAGRNKGYVTGEEYGPPADYQDQAVIDNYYYDEGPPVITYYPPPPDYYYLYAWDPYPFWWGGYWFPGYYVLNDFTIVVDGHHHHHHHHRDGDHHRDGGDHHRDATSGTEGSTTKLITNRVVDKSTNKLVTINPVTRTVERGTATSASGRSGNSSGFANSGTRRGAEGILKNSVTRDRAATWGGSSVNRTYDSSPSTRAGTGYSRNERPAANRPYMGTSRSSASPSVGRSFDPAPSLRGRSYDMGRSSVGESRQIAPASRSISPGSGSGGRGFSSPRSFSPAPSGGSGGFRSPGSGGGFNRGIGGGGCRGGRC